MSARTASILGLAVALLGGGGTAAERSPLGYGPEVVAAGREIYNAGCTVCHGRDGEAGDRAPALAAARRYVRTGDEEVFDAVKNGIPGTGMPAVGLSDEDAWRVTVYIRSLRATAADFPPEGNVDAGEGLFWGKAKCGDCHMVGGRGGLIGPDLTDLGGRLTVKAIEEALTVPKLRAPLGYEPAVIRTAAGETLTGVLRNRHNFSYQLLDREGRLHMLSADEIDSVEIGEKSPMPADVDRRLTEEEFRDLLAFLSRLTR